MSTAWWSEETGLDVLTAISVASRLVVTTLPLREGELAESGTTIESRFAG